MPDKNNVMITNATRNNTTVSNITFFVGDHVISQGISFSCSSGCFHYNLRKTMCVRLYREIGPAE